MTASSHRTTCAIPASLPPLAIAVLLLLAFPPRLHGAFVSGIEVISESYQISAGWTHDYQGDPVLEPPQPITSGGYSLASSDGTPVAASTTSPDGGFVAHGSVDEFSVHNDSRAPLRNTIIDGFRYYDTGGIDAGALGVWDFRTASAVLNLNLVYTVLESPDATGHFRVTLADMTTSTTLLDLFPFLGFMNAHGTPNYKFNVTSGDVYELSIDAFDQNWDGDRTSEDVAASIQSPVDAPDGGLTIGMLGIGISGLAFVRRKCQ